MPPPEAMLLALQKDTESGRGGERPEAACARRAARRRRALIHKSQIRQEPARTDCDPSTDVRQVRSLARPRDEPTQVADERMSGKARQAAR